MKLLEQLVLTAGVPGREHRVRRLIQSQIKGLFDEVRTDALGSLICVRKARPKAKSGGASGGGARTTKKPLRIMLAAHMDQIGFMVRHIDDKGFLRVNAVGGFDTRNLFARLVSVCPDVNDPKKDLPGVMNPGGKPVHIASAEDRKKIPEIEELTIDLGLPAAQVKKKVKLGDMVVLRAPFEKVGQTVVSQCMDNRIACWVAIEAVKKLAKSGGKYGNKSGGGGHGCEVHCVFTVQEEVGLRGAGTAAFGIEPDIGIAIDTTLCCDTPGIPSELRVTEQGKGAALTVMDGASIADLSVLEAFESVAKKAKIPHQRSILPRGGTDAAAVQRAAAGTKAFTLSCPTRYIHTVTEMVHLTDLNACRDLLTAYLAQA